MNTITMKFLLWIFYFILVLLPYDLNAQSMIYEGTIKTDEAGGKIAYPFFVMSEPVMNEIYVLDSKSRLLIYASDLFPLYTLGKKDGIESAQGLTVDKEGNIYVLQIAKGKNKRHRISIFSACLKWERDIYLEDIEGDDEFSPYRIAIDSKGNAYISGYFFPGVLFLNSEFKLVGIISPEEEGAKAKINNVIVDGSDRIYLVSEETSRVYVYDQNRKFIFKFGEKGGSSGKLSRPKAVGIDDERGIMYVVDYMRHSILVYDKKGEYMFEFGGMGWREGWFQHPIDLSIAKDGKVVVADFFNNRVQVFQHRN